MNISTEKSEEFARWFKCLSDPTRVKLLNIVASAIDPLTVGEIVELMGKSQSTVSHHLRVLATQRFVFTEVDNTRTYVRINKKCMTALPDAAEKIMAIDTKRKKKES
jgi:DNA-binding transcriptional ArsR family regulator